MKYNDNSNWYVASESGSEPVSLDELKAHLNMSFSGKSTFDDDDDYLTKLISVCREVIENYCGLSIKAKTLVAYLRNECGGVELPYGPVFSITESKDKNGNNVQLVLVGDKFPSVEGPLDDYIKVTYTVGFTRIGAIPKPFKQAIMEECAWRYNNRGSANMDNVTFQVLNRGSVEGLGSSQTKSILAPYKKRSWLT